MACIFLSDVGFCLFAGNVQGMNTDSVSLFCVLFNSVQCIGLGET